MLWCNSVWFLQLLKHCSALVRTAMLGLLCLMFWGHQGPIQMWFVVHDLPFHDIALQCELYFRTVCRKYSGPRCDWDYLGWLLFTYCFYKKCMVSLRVVTFRRMLVSLSVAWVGLQPILIPLFVSFLIILVEFVFCQWSREILYVYTGEPFI
jgi:hypothetical protein